MVTVWNWFRKKQSAPLAGAPVHPRQKTYSAVTGYVYHYFYEGHRDVDQGTEYVFSISADRKTSFPVSVFLRTSVVDAWIQEHERDLNESERHAIATLALKHALDERDHPDEMHDLVRPALDEFTLLCETLDLT